MTNSVGRTQPFAYRGHGIVRSIQEAFPQELSVTLRYVQLTTCSGAGEYGTQVFTVNSVYAPGGSTTVGTKHQPKGFDQYSVFYLEYLVRRTKVTATVTPIGATAGTVGYLALTLSDNVGIAWANGNDLLEDAKTVWSPFGGLGAQPCTASQVWDLSREVLGGTDYRSAISGSYSGTATTGPSDSWYCQVSYVQSAPAGVAAGVNVMVEMDMEVLFLSRRNIAQS